MSDVLLPPGLTPDPSTFDLVVQEPEPELRDAEEESVVFDQDAEPDEPEQETYDPSAHTVEDVKLHVTENPQERDAILEAEEAGKNRSTLIDWLVSFQPGG